MNPTSSMGPLTAQMVKDMMRDLDQQIFRGIVSGQPPDTIRGQSPSGLVAEVQRRPENRSVEVRYEISLLEMMAQGSHFDIVLHACAQQCGTALGKRITEMIEHGDLDDLIRKHAVEVVKHKMLGVVERQIDELMEDLLG